MNIYEFVNNPNWYSDESLSALLNWATSASVEKTGEGRRQLGYLDGYTGEAAASKHADYMKGYLQGASMKTVQQQIVPEGLNPYEPNAS